MIEMLARLTVEDTARFWTSFRDDGAPLRARGGSLGAVALEEVERPGEVVLLLRWESRELFDQFRDDPAATANMIGGGLVAPPQFVEVLRVGELAA